MENRCLDKDGQGGTDKLSTAQEHVFVVACSAVLPIQGSLDRPFPELLSFRVAVQNLLRIELDNLLKAYRDDLWLDFAHLARAEPWG